MNWLIGYVLVYGLAAILFFIIEAWVWKYQHRRQDIKIIITAENKRRKYVSNL